MDKFDSAAICLFTAILAYIIGHMVGDSAGWRRGYEARKDDEARLTPEGD